MGALIAPLIIPAYFLVISVASGQSFRNTVVILFPVILFSYLSTCCLGLPMVSFLERIGQLKMLALAATGALAGIIVWFLAAQWLVWMLSSTAVFSWVQAAWGAAMGISVAVVFGLISGVKFSNEKLHDS